MSSNESLIKLHCVIWGVFRFILKEEKGSKTRDKKHDWYQMELQVEGPYALDKMFITYNIIVFKLSWVFCFIFPFMGFVYGNSSFTLWVEQVWVQDNYAILIKNVEFYFLDNPKTIYINIKGPIPSAYLRMNMSRFF